MNKKHTGKIYTITIPELMFLLFGRKMCRQCNIKLTRRRTDEIRTDISTKGSVGGSFGSVGLSTGQKVKVYSHYYSCPQCKKEISLSELAKKNND